MVTRRSVTGILLLLNNTPITWVTKRQKTVETSTYGSELVASRIAVDLIIEHRYKLRMLGVDVEESSLMVGDNMAVVLNATKPIVCPSVTKNMSPGFGNPRTIHFL